LNDGLSTPGRIRIGTYVVSGTHPADFSERGKTTIVVSGGQIKRTFIRGSLAAGLVVTSYVLLATRTALIVSGGQGSDPIRPDVPEHPLIIATAPIVRTMPAKTHGVFI
jgi:hypothetical protein